MKTRSGRRPDEDILRLTKSIGESMVKGELHLLSDDGGSEEDDEALREVAKRLVAVEEQDALGKRGGEPDAGGVEDRDSTKSEKRNGNGNGKRAWGGKEEKVERKEERVMRKYLEWAGTHYIHRPGNVDRLTFHIFYAVQIALEMHREEKKRIKTQSLTFLVLLNSILACGDDKDLCSSYCKKFGL